MEDIKEKMLCAIRNNILLLEQYCKQYSILNKSITLTIWCQETFKEKVLYYKEHWWSLSKSKQIVQYGSPCKEYFITNGHFTFKITEEEFNEILELRREKILENQLLELDKLCNTKI